MTEKPIRVVRYSGSRGLGCLAAALMVMVGGGVHPDILPGPALYDMAAWLLLTLLIAALLEAVSRIFSPDQILELEGDWLRERRGRSVYWERRLPGPSGFRLWHFPEAGYEDWGHPVETLLIEIQSKVGNPLVFSCTFGVRNAPDDRLVPWPEWELSRGESIEEEFPRWEGPPLWDLGHGHTHPGWIALTHTFDGDRMLKALMERATSTG